MAQEKGKRELSTASKGSQGGVWGAAAAACIIASNAKVCNVMSKRATRPSPLCTKRFSYSFLYFAICACFDVLHLPHLAHVLHPYGTLRLSLQFCAPLVFSLSLFLTCNVWQPQDKASRGCILDHFRGICYADASKINDVIFALGSSHDTSTHRAFYLIALIIVFNFRPNT